MSVRCFLDHGPPSMYGLSTEKERFEAFRSACIPGHILKVAYVQHNGILATLLSGATCLSLVLCSSQAAILNASCIHILFHTTTWAILRKHDQVHLNCYSHLWQGKIIKSDICLWALQMPESAQAVRWFCNTTRQNLTTTCFPAECVIRSTWCALTYQIINKCMYPFGNKNSGVRFIMKANPRIRYNKCWRLRISQIYVNTSVLCLEFAESICLIHLYINFDVSRIVDMRNKYHGCLPTDRQTSWVSKKSNYIFAFSVPLTGRYSPLGAVGYTVNVLGQKFCRHYND